MTNTPAQAATWAPHGDPMGLLQRAVSAHQQGDLSEAEALYRAALARDPRQPSALHFLGVLHGQRGQFGKADHLIRQALTLDSASSDANLDHARVLLQLKRYEDAIRAADRALALAPHQIAPLVVRGALLLLLKRREAALASFDRAVALEPRSPVVHQHRAEALFELGRFGEALAAYEHALALSSDDAAAHKGRGNALVQLDRYEEAFVAYAAALALRPDFADAWLGRGNGLLKLGRHDEALVAYDQALATQPDLAAAWVGRGSVLSELQRDGEALAAYDKALTIQPNLTEAWVGGGNVLGKLKRHQDALEAYDSALGLEPGLAEALFGRGTALNALERPQEAIAAYRQALEQGSDPEQTRYALAALGAEPAPAAAPRKFVASLFNNYAEKFDRHLVETLNYRIPALLVDAMSRLASSGDLDVLDLGCGTGLVGVQARPRARTLTGIDLSAKMLAQARQRQIYDHLICRDLSEFLQTQTNSFDLAVAADVFVYIGDLCGIFRGVRRALREGGLFGFSVEAVDGGDFVLRSALRYAHSAEYLRRLAGEHGFIVENIEPRVIREERSTGVAGYIAVLRA